MRHRGGIDQDLTSLTRAAGPARDDQKGSEPPNNKKAPAAPPGPIRGLFGIAAFAMITVLLFLMFNSMFRGQRTTLEQFETMWKNKEVVPGSVEVRDDAVVFTRKDGPDSAQRTRYIIEFNALSAKPIIERVDAITHGD